MHYRDAFQLSRLINIFFYTSNVDKLLQARYLFGKRGLAVRHFRSRKEPYDEDYAGSSATLLQRAVQQLLREFSIKSCFFIEDTSLRIEALSIGSDYPGLRVKEWFDKTQFETLDRRLIELGNNRAATVKSDIALHLPGLSSPIYFHGETLGRVADTPATFPRSVAYPWLTPSTFNGWFIPDGQHWQPERLGEMQIEKSVQYDFRAKSINALLDRYIEFNAAANLPAQYYIVRQGHTTDPAQLRLNLASDKRVVVVVGPKCAGKTTFADLAMKRGDVSIIEASSLFRDIASANSHQCAADADAFKLLSQIGLDAVAIEAAKCIDAVAEPLCVVTGLRTVEEILYLRRLYRGVRVVLVDCDQRIRFERQVRRGRETHILTFREFQENDEVQALFGVLSVGRDVCDFQITNEGSIDEYRDSVDDLLDTILGQRQVLPADRNPSELYRSLKALQRIGDWATCDEIAMASANFGKPVRKYNTNRALKAVPEFAERANAAGEKLKYRITSRGELFLELMELSQNARFQQEQPKPPAAPPPR